MGRGLMRGSRGGGKGALAPPPHKILLPQIVRRGPRGPCPPPGGPRGPCPPPLTKSWIRLWVCMFHFCHRHANDMHACCSGWLGIVAWKRAMATNTSHRAFINLQLISSYKKRFGKKDDNFNIVNYWCSHGISRGLVNKQRLHIKTNSTSV